MIKKIFKKIEEAFKFKPLQNTRSNFNYKGQKYPTVKPGQNPKPTRQHIDSLHNIDPQLQIQPRHIRVKNFVLGIMFLLWYIIATLFIMYRLRSDDLDVMQKDVLDRINTRKEIQTLNKQ